MSTYLKNHFSTILKTCDYVAATVFILAAIADFSVGNIAAGAANCCALVWVLIARQRQMSSETYSTICNDMFNMYDILKAEYIEIKNKLSKNIKDNANDNFNSKK